MERELLRILSSIKEKTGLTVQAVSENGLYYASTKQEFIPIDSEISIKDGEVVQKGEFTYFKFSFGGNKFIGLIEGVSKAEINYAHFISSNVELSQAKNAHLSYDEELGLIINGNSTKGRILHFISKYGVSKTPVFIMYIKCDEGRAVEVQDFVRSYYGERGGAVTLTNDSCAYVKHVESEDLLDVDSPSKQAEGFRRCIFEELGLNVTVYVGGTVKSFTDVSLSYSQAVATEKMSELFNIKGGVIAYKDVLLAKILEDNSAVKIEEYFNTLSNDGGVELFSDEELITTGEAFLSNNLNVSETARAMYIHRNTLIYRLDKIERLTGLDLRKFTDALNFRILYVLSKLKG